jgi:cytochrome c
MQPDRSAARSRRLDLERQASALTLSLGSRPSLSPTTFAPIWVGLATVLMTLLAIAGAARADGDPRRGAELYRACVACHTLEPGLHTTGPSLAGLMGRPAGGTEGFGRYSPNLRDAGFDWDSVALDAWLAYPETMIPGTYMDIRGIPDAQARADLIAFLETVTAPGGAEQAVAGGLIPTAYVRDVAPEPIGGAAADGQVKAMRHCGGGYLVTTEDGIETPYWEKNVRLKIDSTETGPPEGVPVVLGAGMRGDRVSVIFGSLAELEDFIDEKC